MRRPYPALDADSRRVPADSGTGSGQVAGTDSHGRPGGGDDYGIHRYLQLGFHSQSSGASPVTNIVMLVTVIVVVATHNLAFGVLAGVLLAALFFANKVGHYMLVTSELDEQTDTR